MEYSETYVDTNIRGWFNFCAIHHSTYADLLILKMNKPYRQQKLIFGSDAKCSHFSTKNNEGLKTNFSYKIIFLADKK